MMNLRNGVPGALALLTFGIVGCGGSGNDNTDNRPVVYSMTNRAADNAVMAWRVNSDGTFATLGTFATGGSGSPTETPSAAGPADGIDPLGSQGSLTMSSDHKFLFAVNAGSGSLTSFRVQNDGSLVQADVQSSGGTAPVSVTVRGSRVYVVNVNDPANHKRSTINGFNLGSNGSLSAIAGSKHNLSAADARPACISFSPDGNQLIVTEQGVAKVSAYAIHADGSLGDPMSAAAAGPAPFGFAFSSSGTLVVTEAATSTLSSFQLSGGAPSVVTNGLADAGLAACWVTTHNDRAYAVNSASNDLTTYSVAADGSLSIRDASIPTDGDLSIPLDATVTDSMYFQLLGAKGKIVTYSIDGGGDLHKLAVNETGLPMLGTQGIAVRP